MRKIVIVMIIIWGSPGYSYYHNTIVFAAEKMPDDSRLTGALPASSALQGGDQGSYMKLAKILAGKPRPLGEGGFPNEAVTDTTDVHYTGKYCKECHEQTPREGVKLLRYQGDFKQLCRCHYKTTGRDIHPADIEPSPEIKDRVPDDFPLKDGKIACITCHDIFAQCRDRKLDAMFSKEQFFLRGAPYKKQVNFCFKCHNEIKFKKYNPHKQLDQNNSIVVLKCLYCHSEAPDERRTEYEDVVLIGNLEMLCDRCHNKASEQSLHAKHLRKPSAKVFASIKQLENRFGIVLPLNDDGKITCVTCHNPHQKGVIPAERAGAKGAGKLHRHRLPGNMCIQCHQM